MSQNILHDYPSDDEITVGLLTKLLVNRYMKMLKKMCNIEKSKYTVMFTDSVFPVNLSNMFFVELSMELAKYNIHIYQEMLIFHSNIDSKIRLETYMKYPICENVDDPQHYCVYIIHKIR